MLRYFYAFLVLSIMGSFAYYFHQKNHTLKAAIVKTKAANRNLSQPIDAEGFISGKVASRASKRASCCRFRTTANPALMKTNDLPAISVFCRFKFCFSAKNT
jgi:hypothetical protein